MISRKARMSRWTKAVRKCDAQALVEIALTFPLLLLLLLGGAEIARLAYVAVEVSNAAKAAVQYGAQNRSTAQDATGMQTAASNDASDLSSLGLKATVSSSCICSDGSASTCSNTDCSNSHIEQVLTVTTAVNFDPLFHVSALPTSFTLHGQATQKVLQ